MKKSLVLAMAMALGVTASAYAANPFSDVPAGHWAYDSIDKLAAAGVIDGMGDGTYQGDKTMTRYEMAQIVAKAMAKGANVDKLAAEFADELDNLGVRVANLEKKADNVKITGTLKASMWNFHGTAKHAVHQSENNFKGTNHQYRLRSELYINGKINEDWQYNATLRNEQWLDSAKAGKGEEDVKMKDAYVKGKIGGVKVTAGRYAEYLEDGDVLDDRADGIKVEYGKKIKLTAAYAQNNYGYWYSTAAGIKDYDAKFAYARVDGKVGVIKAHAAYYQFNDVATIARDSKIAAVGINMPVAKDLSLSAAYFKTGSDYNNLKKQEIDDDGFTVALDYKGASAKKVGSWGLTAKYYDLVNGVTIAHTADGMIPAGGPSRISEYLGSDNMDPEGFKGFKVGGAVTVAKNIRWSLDYYGVEGKANGKHYDTVYSMLRFDF